MDGERRAAVAACGVGLLTIVLATAPAAAQDRPARGGSEVYRAACAACHGANGTGMPRATVGFETPLPDFTDCSFATREPDADWMAVAHDGGPARAFDRRMPAFGEALTERELQGALTHIRTFCRSAAWPRGELNLPRALVTEKAYPEDEAVLTVSSDTTGDGRVATEFLYERRIGARSQYEIVVPWVTQGAADGQGWQRGLGDVAVALKHAFFHSLEDGRILSGAFEVVLPTGNEMQGLGAGTTVFEPFAAFGQMLPGDSFVQAQIGLELPAEGTREGFWRATAGKSFTEGRFGRTWTPMVEVLAARELEEGAGAHWDVLPQLQVTLSRRQHVMLNVGVRMPVNDRAGRPTRVLTYLLWDWFDGGLFDGWR
jgi:mono/diheme cytochrome c family protein